MDVSVCKQCDHHTNYDRINCAIVIIAAISLVDDHYFLHVCIHGRHNAQCERS